MSKATLCAALAAVTLCPALCQAADTVKVEPTGESGSGTTTITVKFPNGNQDLFTPIDSVKIGDTTYTGNQISTTTTTGGYTVTITTSVPTGDQDVTVKANLNNGATAESTKTKVTIKRKRGIDDMEVDEEEQGPNPN